MISWDGSPNTESLRLQIGWSERCLAQISHTTTSKNYLEQYLQRKLHHSVPPCTYYVFDLQAEIWHKTESDADHVRCDWRTWLKLTYVQALVLLIALVPYQGQSLTCQGQQSPMQLWRITGYIYSKHTGSYRGHTGQIQNTIHLYYFGKVG